MFTTNGTLLLGRESPIQPTEACLFHNRSSYISSCNFSGLGYRWKCRCGWIFGVGDALVLTRGKQIATCSAWAGWQENLLCELELGASLSLHLHRFPNGRGFNSQNPSPIRPAWTRRIDSHVSGILSYPCFLCCYHEGIVPRLGAVTDLVIFFESFRRIWT